MKYKVMFGVMDFTFDDSDTAMNFAKLAKEYFTPNKYAKYMKPLISFEDEEDKEEEEC